MGTHSLSAMKPLLAVLLVSVSVRSKPARGNKVWHESDTEEECGNFTSLFKEEKPSELCTELNTNTTVCSCSTRDITMEEGETTINTEAQWVFKCGTCQMKLILDENENGEKNEEGGRKKNQKKKKLTKAERKRVQERAKMRKRKKGNDKKSQPVQPRTDQ